MLALLLYSTALTSQYVVLNYNRDHTNCIAPDAVFATGDHTYYLSVGINSECYHNPPDNVTAKSSAVLKSAADRPYMNLQVGSTGITFFYYSDASCATQVYQRLVGYGSCYNGATVDVTSDLPTPVPGRVFYQQWTGSSNCGNSGHLASPFFLMHSTSCFTGDFEYFCGNGPTSTTYARKHVYASTDGTCKGRVTQPDPGLVINQCASLARGAYSAKLLWCGGPSLAWARMHLQHPVCDAPDSGTPFAVDLSRILGPKCTTVPSPGAGQSCYLPLGYDGGPPLGTDCEDSCATTYHWGRRTHRIGSTDAFCEDSTKKYGNWCAPHPSDAGTCVPCSRAWERLCSPHEVSCLAVLSRSFCGPKFAIEYVD